MNASFSGFLNDVFFLINLTSLALAATSDAPNDENSEASDTVRALFMGKIACPVSLPSFWDRSAFEAPCDELQYFYLALVLLYP